VSEDDSRISGEVLMVASDRNSAHVEALNLSSKRSKLRWRRHQVNPDIASPFVIVSLAWAVGITAYFIDPPA
jgi:hypothetical protein